MAQINKYEIVYGQIFKSKRIVWATSEVKVVEYCMEKYPEIFPIADINLLEENVDERDVKGA